MHQIWSGILGFSSSIKLPTRLAYVPNITSLLKYYLSLCGKTLHYHCYWHHLPFKKMELMYSDRAFSIITSADSMQWGSLGVLVASPPGLPHNEYFICCHHNHPRTPCLVAVSLSKPTLDQVRFYIKKGTRYTAQDNACKWMTAHEWPGFF